MVLRWITIISVLILISQECTKPRVLSFLWLICKWVSSFNPKVCLLRLLVSITFKRKMPTALRIQNVWLLQVILGLLCHVLNTFCAGHIKFWYFVVCLQDSKIPGRNDGFTVSAFVYRSSLVRALAGVILLCSWVRNFTLSTQVYKWVPANLMLG